MRLNWVVLVAGITFLNACAHGSKAPVPGQAVPRTPYLRDYVAPGQHYRLHLPDTWQLARFAVHERNGEVLRKLHPAAQSWVACDYLPYAANQPSEQLFGIVTFKTDDWLAMAESVRAQFEQVVAQTPQYVFAALLPAAVVYPPGSDDARLFDSMRRSLTQIQSAFIFPDGRSALANQYATATGNYEAYVPGPGAAAKWRKLILTLRADGSALLGEESGGARFSRRDQARWQQVQDVVLMQILTPGGKPAGMPLVWTVATERLLPRAWDRELYGSSGLLMRKTLRMPQGLSKN